jgi:hypothetical protein
MRLSREPAQREDEAICRKRETRGNDTYIGG